MMSSSYVISSLALTLAVLAPRLSAIEQRTVGEEAPSAERARFVERTEKELDSLDRSIDELRAKAKERGREGRIELEKQAARLDRRRARAEKRLQELKISSGERWRQFRGHVSDLLEDLREDVRDVSGEEEEERPTPLP